METRIALTASASLEILKYVSTILIKTTIELNISEVKCSESASSACEFVSFATLLSAREREKSMAMQIIITENVKILIEISGG
jgi:hypothetical protein